MPRTRRAYGRPGTPVIPAQWGASHAPVITAAMRGTCQAFAPGAGPLEFDPVERVSKRAPATPVYDGPCRIQALNDRDKATVAGDQTQTVLDYLVTVTLTGHGPTDEETQVLADGADLIETGHRIHVTGCDEDPTLIGRDLRVTRAVRGTERFERDLFCVLDDSTPIT